jgi:hypothetical protein
MLAYIYLLADLCSWLLYNDMIRDKMWDLLWLRHNVGLCRA